MITKDIMSLAPQSISSDLPIKRNHSFISDHATRVRITQNNSTHTTRMHHSHLIYSYNINSDSGHAMSIRLTQTNSTLAKQKPNQNFIHINCATQNQLTPAQQFNTFKSNQNSESSYF